MSEAFWQAKIQGLLYDFDLNKLKQYSGNEAQPFLDVLQLVEPSFQLLNAHLITEASDRAVLNASGLQVNSSNLKIAHLLSGAELPLSLNSSIYSSLKRGNQENGAIGSRGNGQIDSKQLFWWLWRCLPQAVSQQLGDESLLMPAATVLPDASVWSHASLTAALAGALTGYERPTQPAPTTSHPYLVTFSFTPVQELIKASRKMRDFWAGSWVLHYLSAKICWKLAQIYGPDCLVYPSLYQQPLIDHWLRTEWEGFNHWVEQPSDRALLTAGFPNVIVALLPESEVNTAMQIAQTTLKQEWLELGHLVFAELRERRWTRNLQESSRTWNGWLKAQWQPYWSALPVGQKNQPLTTQEILQVKDPRQHPWLEAQNRACNLKDIQEREVKLFFLAEFDFLQAVHTQQPVSVNVGSWWPYIFDEVRSSLFAVKNARNWDIPTAFGPRSTISGIGPVVYPDPNEDIAPGKKNHKPITEGDTKSFWQEHAGFFNGSEQLNASETLKRCLHRVLPGVLGLDQNAIDASYPDLTAGVAGYLKVHSSEQLDHFRRVCQLVRQQLDQKLQESPEAKRDAIEDMGEKWGIPWIDEYSGLNLRSYPPRLLNPGWLVTNLEISENLKSDYRTQFQKQLAHFYPNNNPTDWYVLAAGDGDGMRNWLLGTPLKKYQDYMPMDAETEDSSNSETAFSTAFKKLRKLNKRMGPSTHNALSRALLDFSNQLVPYLTEQRYAGRLIYSGGDDVLAYTNLWEWDSWLWDIRQCFRGDEDPEEEFESKGDYWRWLCDEPKSPVTKRPLFTMGKEATISFGIVIAHHSVPLAIALENLFRAEGEEEGAKSHSCLGLEHPDKNAVQVRVLYGNGNQLKSTAKFQAFDQWRQLLNTPVTPQQQASLPALFEQTAQIWSQFPAPDGAIAPWTKAFGERRDIFSDEQLKGEFQQRLVKFIQTLSQNTQEKQRNLEIQNWLKLAAFTLRRRQITIKSEGLS